MGDILHALPAASSLKHSFPDLPLTWVVEAQWAALLAGNPFIDRLVTIDRNRPGTWWRTRQALCERRFSLAIDFQGLLKSAFVASLARPDRIAGFHRYQVRERAASLFYSIAVQSQSIHAVDRNLDLAAAAGASRLLRQFPLPMGEPEGDLPETFLLASPFAGWASKQWPLEYYAQLAQISEIPVVLNGPPSAKAALDAIPNVTVQISSLSGLIDATRRATSVVGVDSGPMHLAAALNKPGVAIFGPTDEARNGPYGGSLKVLRAAGSVAHYRPGGPKHRGAYLRGAEIDPAMRAVTPEQVLSALKSQVVCPA